MKEIVPVTSAKLMKTFIDFPHDLYANDPNYVPELFIAQRDLLTPGKHPFHEHSQIALFLAYENGKPVGRIAAIMNNNHNQFNGTQDGFFGFFDCKDDAEAAAMLFAKAQEWLREKGAKTMIGPVNFSTNETCGLLIDGFNSPPVAMMTYNQPYYIGLMEKNGFGKKVDLWAYQIISKTYDDKPLRVMEAFKQRLEQRGITIRKVNMKDFKGESAKLREVYNRAWDKNLGFVPMTDKEFDYLAKDLKLILDPDFCMVAEHNGKIIGFSLCIPDVNFILRTVKRGRLFPTGIFKLLLNRKKIKAIRVIALGVVEGYRKMGIEAVFYGDIIKKSLAKNIHTAEASWILENNDLMNRAIQHINGEVYKTYRIYEKAI